MPKLTKAKLGTYRKRLLQIFKELGGKIEQMEDSVLRAETEPSPDEAEEFSSDNYHQEFQLGLIENEEEILREVHGALERIEAGGYGECEACSKPIPARRLDVLPYARHCVDCQREIEESGGSDED